MADTNPRAHPYADALPTLALPYGRISGSERQRDGYSLDQQLGTNRKACADQSWLIDAEFEDILTGKRDDRPGYVGLLERARRRVAEGRRVVVVCKWLTRFGRRVAERVRAYEELRDMGVAIYSVLEGGFVSELTYNILAAVAQEESRINGERVQEMAEYIREKGWLPGRIPNWGYRWRDPTPQEKALGAPRRVLDEHPEEGPAVRELWRRAAAGETGRSLYRWVASLPTGVRGGRRMSSSAVQNVLLSPVYVARPGTRVDAETMAEALDRPMGHWPALVDDETWLRVAALRARGARVPAQASGRHLLTGLLYCPECGGRMQGQSRRREARLKNGTPTGRLFTVRRYICQAGRDGDDGGDGALACRYSCEATTLDEDVLTQAIAAVEALAGLTRAGEAALRRRWAQDERRASEGAPDVARRRRQLREQMAQHRRDLGEASLRLMHGGPGGLTQVAYDAVQELLEGAIRDAAQELARLDDPPAGGEARPDLDDALREVGGLAGALRGGSLPQKRDALASLVARIRPVRVARGAYTAAIDWTPLGRVIARLAGALPAPPQG